MSFVDRFQNEPWFAFSNIAVFGTLGYLFLDRVLEQSEPAPIDVTKDIPAQAPQPVLPKKNPVHKIVFSGGPCAGKTTACQQVKKVFERRGYKVMIVPEAAKTLVESGAMIRMDRLTAEERVHFQYMLVNMVMHLEDYFVKLAEMSGQPSIIVCDRGTMDVQAYLSGGEFDCMMEEGGWSENYLRDKRYDEVIFMVTAADGAEEFYSLANNVARHQTAEQARALDVKTLAAWSGHSHMNIIGNIKGHTFQDKIQKVIAVVDRIVGHKESFKKVEKYLLSEIDFPPEQIKFLSTVEDTFLVNENPKEYISDRIQKVTDHGVQYYYRVIVRNLGTITNFIPSETRTLLTPLDYVYFLSNKKDKSLNTVERIRTCFVYQKQFFVLYKILLPTGTIQILKTTTLVKQGVSSEAILPNFIQIEKDISKDPQHKLHEYAKIKK